MNKPFARIATFALSLGLAWLLIAAAAPAPTFSRDVAPIVLEQCAPCHRPGEVAPFSLLTYDDVAKRARQIGIVTERRLMPPWFATTEVGAFHGDLRLTDEQIETVQRWVAAGAPEGDPADLPPRPTFVEGWSDGEPDLIVPMDGTFTVPAEGRDIYQCVVFRVDLPEDRYVRKIEFRPGNRAVVHHALVYTDPERQGRRLDAATADAGYASMFGPGFRGATGLGAWAPGSLPIDRPEASARTLPAGADIVAQIHYHPNGKAEADRSVLGIYFSDTPPTRPIDTLPMGSVAIDIPAGEAEYVLEDTFTAPMDLLMHGVFPHAHYLARTMLATVTFPDGTTRDLIRMEPWNFNWQNGYVWQEPWVLPTGASIHMRFVYDNSAANPWNPNQPPKRVTFGEQSTDEMGALWLQVSPAEPERRADLLRLIQQQKRGRLDGDFL